MHRANIPAFGNTRFFADTPDQNFLSWLKVWVTQRRNLGLSTGMPLQALALSGGSADGAFGAGVLVGWGQRGDRPKFDLVTGISAGALVGSGAVIGTQYDHKIVEAFKTDAFAGILAIRPQRILFSGGISSGDHLARQLEIMVDNAMVDDFARAYHQGRRFLVVTSNLDLQRPVAWDVTGIAASNHPARYQFVRKVLLASAALPGVFPPVSFPVFVDGQDYEELHVDGGVTQGLFLLPGGLDAVPHVYRQAPELRIDSTVIINGTIFPDYDPVRARTLKVANQSLQTLLKNRTLGDVREIFRIGQSHNARTRMIYLPHEQADSSQATAFEAAYMRRLYQYGFERGYNADSWLDRLPQY